MSARIVIRDARAEDYFEIAQIWDAGWRATGVPSPEQLTIAQLTERLKRFVDDGADLYSVERENSLVGLILLVPDQCQLSQLFISPDAHRSGIGSICLEYVKQQMPRGFWLSVAEANRGAIAFYEKHQLRFTKRVYRNEYDRFDLHYRWDGFASNLGPP